MNSFYLPRWQLYFNYLKNNLEEKPTQAPDFFTWERQWVKDNQKLQPETKSRPLNEVVKEIMAI
jgi:alpha-N-acetylglucosaminidase